MKVAMKKAAPMKRKAEPTNEGPKAKKAKTESKKKVDVAQEKVDKFRAGFDAHAECEKSKDFVANNQTSLYMKVEDRAAVNNSAVDAIQGACTVVETDLKGKTAEAQAEVDEQKADMQTQQTAVDTATAAFDAATVDFADKEVDYKSKVEAEEAAIAAFNQAEQAKKALVTEGNTNGEWLTEVKAGFECLNGWKEAAADSSKQGKKDVTMFGKLLTKCKCDKTMIDAAINGLTSFPREGFMGLAFDECVKFCDTYVLELQTKIDTQADRENAQDAVIAQATGVKEAAAAATEAAKELMDTAKVAKKEATAVKKAAEKDIKKEVEKLDALEIVHAGCVDTETAFADTLAVFADLMTHTDVVPEVPEEEVAPVEEEVVDNSNDVEMVDAVEEAPVEEMVDAVEVPFEEEAAPVVEEAAPVEEEAAPVVEEAAPAVEEEVVEEAAAPAEEDKWVNPAEAVPAQEMAPVQQHDSFY